MLMKIKCIVNRYTHCQPRFTLTEKSKVFSWILPPNNCSKHSPTIQCFCSTDDRSETRVLLFRCDEINNKTRNQALKTLLLRATRCFNAICMLRRLLLPSRMALAMRNSSELFLAQFSENSTMLNPLGIISVTADRNGFILLFGI